jgi:hypothetical protein
MAPPSSKSRISPRKFLHPVKLSQAHFDQALAKLEEQVEDTELEEDRPLVEICSSVSLHDVLNFFEGRDSLGFRIRFCPENDRDEFNLATDPKRIMGRLFAVELPSSPHEIAGANISHQILSQVSLHTLPEVYAMGSPRLRIGAKLKEPDMTLTPDDLGIGGPILDDGTGNPFPNLVVEIALSEALKQLRKELADWISAHTSVQVAIGIKIFPERHGTRRMLALLHRRGAVNPDQSIEFGTDVGTAAGLALQIFVSDLYFGIPPAHLSVQLRTAIQANEVLAVSLQQLQVKIMKRL